MNFERDEMVTALPCDYRHYFHTHCILNWSEKQSACPLCKKYFAMSSIQDFNNRLTIETDRQRHEMGLAPSEALTTKESQNAQYFLEP